MRYVVSLPAHVVTTRFCCLPMLFQYAQCHSDRSNSCLNVVTESVNLLKFVLPAL